MIDKDAIAYSKTKLIGWRKETEGLIGGHGVKPPLPDIRLETLSGLLFTPEVDRSISSEHQLKLRDQRLVLYNGHSKAIRSFNAYLQLPEGVFSVHDLVCPAGVDIRLQPKFDKYLVNGTGGSVEYTGNVPPPSRWSWFVDGLLPNDSIEIVLRTGHIDGLLLPFQLLDELRGEICRDSVDSGATDFYIQGGYQSEWNTRYLRNEFVVPLEYSASDRKITAQKPECPGKRFLSIIGGISI
jgi:hypothetical protein